ncbi:MAG TPA: 50S ribosomal protein L30 [Candidatus Pacearchaeota archaeon]|nr:50S ribosomal protein L30 [Candidatus Pacearchaeota archaeon]
MKKLIVVRIKGLVGVPNKIKRTLELLRLKKKFSCVIVDDTKEKLGMLKKVKSYVAFGYVKPETVEKLLLKRAKKGKKKVTLDEKKVKEFVSKFMENKARLSELNIDPVFHLHPPRGGFKKSTKLEWPKGVLGKNEKINELVERML